MRKIVSIGEVMLRLSPPGRQRITQAGSFDILYSGSEANVSAALATWGLQTAHVTRFPDNPLGHAALSALRARGIDTGFIRMGGDRLGLYFVENGAMTRPTRITYDRLPSAFSESTAGMFSWTNILEGASWFHWSGITPALSQGAADILREALEACAAMQIPVSADINYRSGLWRYGKTPAEVLGPLVAKSQVVVAAETDAKGIFDILPKPGEEPYMSISSQMKARFPSITCMITSLREQFSHNHQRLSGMLWDGGQVWHTPAYELNPIVERIGSGDAFMAGFIYGKLQGWPNGRVINFATAAAAFKHSLEGDVLDASVDEIEALAAGDHGGQIRR
jgi:2-dehydro-3-deoxygluconokinase